MCSSFEIRTVLTLCILRLSAFRNLAAHFLFQIKISDRNAGILKYAIFDIRIQRSFGYFDFRMVLTDDIERLPCSSRGLIRRPRSLISLTVALTPARASQNISAYSFCAASASYLYLSNRQRLYLSQPLHAPGERSRLLQMKGLKEGHSLEQWRRTAMFPQTRCTN